MRWCILSINKKHDRIVLVVTESLSLKKVKIKGIYEEEIMEKEEKKETEGRKRGE